MNFEAVRSSVLRLVEESKNKRNLCLNRLADHVYLVLKSELLVRCYDIVNIVNCPSVLDDLDSFIPYANFNEVQTGLPPFSIEQLKKRITNLHLPYGTGVFVVQLPDYQPRFGYRRSGIVLRQAIIKGEVESLFVAGVEHGSPASNAMDLRMGDCIYSISGYPLDWHTLEQLRHKLIELDGLPSNSNLYDLASYLLNRPYQSNGMLREHNDANNNSSITKVAKESLNSTISEPPILVIIRYPKSSSLWSNQINSNEANESKTLLNNNSSDYYETVLENENNHIGLGLQIGYNQDNNGIQIVSIFKDSQAERDGVLKEGDRIIEVNYENFEGLEAKQALKKVKSMCQNTKYVHIKCLRHSQSTNSPLASHNNVNNMVMNNENYSILDNEDSNDNDIDEKSVLSAATINNSQASLHNVEDDFVVFYNCRFNKHDDEYMDKEENNDENLLNKWLDVFDSDVKILLVHYDIKYSNCGLGIGIEDTVESDDLFGESQHHHYIVEINPEGPIGKDGTLSIGDELLEINHVTLVKKDNSEISSIFNTIPSEGYLICAHFPSESQPSNAIVDNEDDELVLASVVPFTRTLSDGEIPVADFSEVSNSDQQDETCSRSRYAITLDSLNTDDVTDHHSGSDIDDSRHPIKLLTITNPGSRNHSSSYEMLTEDNETDKTITENNKSETDRDKMMIDDHKSTELTTNDSLQRLPMAAKLVKCTESLPSNKSSTQLLNIIPKTNNVSHHDMIRLNEIPKQNDDCEALTVKVLKKAGEILGLELELENGDEKGITLAHITPESPVDRLKYWNQYKSMENIQVQSPYLKHPEQPCVNTHRLRIPTAGDRILSVSEYNFQNMSAFTALRLLRKLISYSGFIKITFIPREFYEGESQVKYNNHSKLFPSEPNLNVN
ncbi:Patj [Schistosoma japonicum]|uniref:Patj n=1 Tax=Schistosoma japonicum TaxID=6182 RepID=A0A4Z2CQK1_SCHJA|nr:Patj [Schistosoma japonicum]